jgi:hypothetical protein
MSSVLADELWWQLRGTTVTVANSSTITKKFMAKTVGELTKE